MKKALSVLLAMALLLSLSTAVFAGIPDTSDPDAVFDPAAESEFTVQALSATTVMITGYTGTGGNMIVPDTIGGKTVVALNASVFAGNQALTGIRLPDSLLHIGDNSFAGCANLSIVSLPLHLTDIGQGAFADCTGLKSLRLPYELSAIKGEAFRGCSALSSLYVPKSVESIGDSAFATGSTLKMSGYEFSAADTYAKNNDNVAFTIVRDSKLWNVDDTIGLVAEYSVLPTTGYYNLETSKITSGTVYNQLKAALGSQATLKAAFNVQLIDVTSMDTLTSLVTDVQMTILPVPAGLDASKAAVYQVAEDGSVTELSNVKVANDQITFKTSKIGNLVVAEKAALLLGDIDGNGVINTSDALMLFQHAAGVRTLTDAQLAVADMTGRGKMDMSDALKLFQLAAGM